MTKICRTCQREKPLTDFSIHQGINRGKFRTWPSSNCKPCASARAVVVKRAMFAADPAKRVAATRRDQRTRRANPVSLEKLRTKDRRRHARHKIRRNANRALRAKAWRMAHPEAARARSQYWYRRLLAYYQTYRRQWNLQNRERYLANTLQAAKRRRARLRGATINDLTTAQWLYIQWRQRHRCVYCGTHCPDALTQDHITPLSKGGGHTLANVVGACRSCNSRKGTGAPPVAVQSMLPLGL